MHYAGDQIGSTRRISDSQGCGTCVPPVCSPALVARRIFSTFGEPVDTANAGSFNELHYGYAGAYGYEEADANALDPLAQLGWLHVGERYYAPELGRFVQRDPIGIRGGVNCYAYVDAYPHFRLDPAGLSFWSWLTGLFGAGASGAAVGGAAGAAGGALAGGIGAGPGFVAGASVGFIGGCLSYAIMTAQRGIMGVPQPTFGEGAAIGALGGLSGGMGAAGASAGGSSGAIILLGGAGGAASGAISGGIGSGWRGRNVVTGGIIGGAFGGLSGMAGESGSTLLGGVLGAEAEVIPFVVP